ncbi:metallophosphoesterase [Erwinia sp. HDF1-3R]|uniref:metallophosphoesterase n=1 Tax=Erwinia sp. HDF1-3R TaxID=3141543 RepID=UPI0031F513E3
MRKHSPDCFNFTSSLSFYKFKKTSNLFKLTFGHISMHLIKSQKMILAILVSAASFHMSAHASFGTAELKESNYIVMADPQAWRMGQGPGSPDPNSSNTTPKWESFNHNVVYGINTLSATVRPQFGIINGDITEFGRHNQLNSFRKVYNGLKFPFYLGLGNHDYERNYNDCRGARDAWLNPNECAHFMADTIKREQGNYAKKLKNFSRDLVGFDKYTTYGSLAYSWDSGGDSRVINHFVQLHLAPNYRVWLNDLMNTNVTNVTKSFTWLRHDLELARKRGVDNIFINFHALEWIDKAYDHEKAMLKAMMKEYKVSAIFVGHTHSPHVEKHPVFGDIPVYTTGALYAGYFDLLKASPTEFQVTSYKVENRVAKEFVKRQKMAVPAAPEKCYSPGQKVPVGKIVKTNFLGDKDKVYYLEQLATGNALDANAKGEVYTNSTNIFNPWQRWRIQYLYTNKVGHAHYKITHNKTGKVLDGSSNGDIYTKGWNNGAYQFWRIDKFDSGSKVQLVSLGTKKILDANRARKVNGSFRPLDLQNNYQTWQIRDERGYFLENVRYFKAAKSDSWRNTNFPRGKQSNSYWTYIGERSLTEAAPCK